MGKTYKEAKSHTKIYEEGIRHKNKKRRSTRKKPARNNYEAEYNKTVI